MSRYRRSPLWAIQQGINHIAQGACFKYDLPYCKPSRVIFCMTLRCNIKCKQCGIWRSPKLQELPLEAYKRIILNLKEWLGPFRVQIAGGEIFIRDDVVDLVRFASSNDVLIGIVTNGTLLDGELGERLIDAGLGFLDISLDGVNPQTHDNIRGVNGVYEKAMSSILNINHLRKKKNSNLVMYLSTIVMGYNMNELVDIVHLVEREHLDGVMLHPLGPPHDEGPNWWERSDLWPKAEELNKLYRIIDTLISMKEEGARIINSIDQFMEMKPYFRDPSAWRGTNCPVGVTNFLLSVDGNIHFCLKQPPIGKYTDPLDQVWASEAARKMRSEIKACSLECSPGNFAFRRSLFKEIRRYLKYK